VEGSIDHSDGGSHFNDAYRLAAFPARPSGGLRPG
jgi:hypothetical protein